MWWETWTLEYRNFKVAFPKQVEFEQYYSLVAVVEKNLVFFGHSHHFQLQKNSTRIQGENIVTIWWSRGCLEKIPTSSMYLEALTGQFLFFVAKAQIENMHVVCRMKNREKHYQRIIGANKIRLSSPRVLCSAKTSPNKRRLLH